MSTRGGKAVGVLIVRIGSYQAGTDPQWRAFDYFA